MKRHCALCRNEAPDSIDLECGNNAENSVALWLCDAHYDEFEKDNYAFQDKYADKIEDEWLETQLAQADALKDG
jgi:hypothetical protein